MNTESNRRKEQAAETRRKLYQSADALFRRYEFDEVSVDAIVEAAGVSKGTFYLYFDSKDALIASFISDYVDRMDVNYKACSDLLPADTPASDVLMALIERIADVLENTIGHAIMKTTYKLLLNGAIDMDAIKGYGRELYKIFDEVVDHGMQQGEFATTFSPQILSRQIVMALRGLTFDWCIRYPDFDLKEQAVMHFKLLLAGIKNNDNNPALR